MVTNTEIDKAFSDANYRSVDNKRVLAEGVCSVLTGGIVNEALYSIMIELKLAYKDRQCVTQEGKNFFYSYFNGETD